MKIAETIVMGSHKFVSNIKYVKIGRILCYWKRFFQYLRQFEDLWWCNRKQILFLFSWYYFSLLFEKNICNLSFLKIKLMRIYEWIYFCTCGIMGCRYNDFRFSRVLLLYNFLARMYVSFFVLIFRYILLSIFE